MSLPPSIYKVPIEKKSKPWFKFILASFAVSFVIAFFFSPGEGNVKLGNNPEADGLVSRVSSFIDLPKNENPDFATVSDPELFKSQFSTLNIQEGDKLLIYPVSKKVIIYRPSNDKVIDIINL